MHERGRRDGRRRRSSAPRGGFDTALNLDGSPIRVSGEELSRAYDEIHYRGSVKALPGYYAWLLGHVGHPGSGSLLDVGCGSGGMLEAAAEAGYDITGLDISRVAVDQARARVPHAELRVGEAEDLPFAASTFDAVTCCGSLEHVTDPARAVQEMRRVARPGAPILVVVPNRHYLFSWVSYLRMKYLPEQSQPIERSATRAEWEAFFAANGLRVRTVHQDDLFYFSTPFMQALAAGVRMVTPMRVCYQFLFVCEQDAHRA